MRSVVLSIVLGLSACVDNTGSGDGDAPASLAALLAAPADSGFARADRPRNFRFPEDHGPHREFRNEWWYFTGHLFTREQRRFGYELTLFRVSLAPPQPGEPGPWSSRELYFGHFAVADIASQTFYVAERSSRAGAGLADSAAEPFFVNVVDWRIDAANATGPTWRLIADDIDHGIDLSVRALKPPVLQGDSGLSQKSASAGNASYYYSMPRWETTGSVRIGATTYAVSGESWLDREWSTSALAAEQIGWDWFALQLDDETELMYYQLRRTDGSVDPYSAGTLIEREGASRAVDSAGVELRVTDYWSNDRGDRYPAGWHLRIPDEGLDLRITPAMADQELDTIVRYWEGAVDVDGQRNGVALQGNGYVELTGYSGAAGGRGNTR